MFVVLNIINTSSIDRWGVMIFIYHAHSCRSEIQILVGSLMCAVMCACQLFYLTSSYTYHTSSPPKIDIVRALHPSLPQLNPEKTLTLDVGWVLQSLYSYGEYRVPVVTNPYHKSETLLKQYFCTIEEYSITQSGRLSSRSYSSTVGKK